MRKKGHSSLASGTQGLRHEATRKKKNGVSKKRNSIPRKTKKSRGADPKRFRSRLAWRSWRGR